MIRLEFLCGVALSFSLFACKDSTVTEPSVREVHYSGTVSQPAAGGFLVYKLSGVWKVSDKNELISGADTTNIIDAKVYGVSSTGVIRGKTTCIAIVGKEAWGEWEVTESSQPQLAAIGSKAVVHFTNTGGVARGAGGPKDVLYPTGSLCSDKPSGLPAFDMVGGVVTIP
ncbi:MAG: hypothetical protein ABJC26_13835 [Gemmatimonadaceae bacterium]